MLAYEMDGKPLAREHGAPVRVVIPDMYGYKGVKWVERITLGVDAGAGLLGAARLRLGCLGGALEWRAEYIERFSATERAVHWVHATAFLVLLATGLALYIPALSSPSAGGRC